MIFMIKVGVVGVVTHYSIDTRIWYRILGMEGLVSEYGYFGMVTPTSIIYLFSKNEFNKKNINKHKLQTNKQGM